MSINSNDRYLILIANGSKIKPEIYRKTAPDNALIIAIDGGANQCRQLGLIPDFLIGDFDSINPRIKNIFPRAKVIHRPEQDLTDMEKALSFALNQNPASLTIYSAFGIRTDHSAGNLLIFQTLETQIPINIIDNYGILNVLRPGTHHIDGDEGKTFSLFSYGPVVSLHLSGFKFLLTPERRRDSFLGISNVFGSEQGTISFDKGVLFYYRLI